MATLSTTAANRYRAILLFGMPGSGKGTQGAVLGQLPDMVHLSTGEIFRKLPKWGELGRKVLHYTSQGRLVPDDVTVEIYRRHVKILELQELLLPSQHMLILDGLPRNPEQAAMLEPMIRVVQIFHLRITDMEEAKERLRARAMRENRLDDMSEEVVLRRMRTYQDETYKTLEYYDPSLVTEVDATGSYLDVLKQIVNRCSELEHLHLLDQVGPTSSAPRRDGTSPLV